MSTVYMNALSLRDAVEALPLDTPNRTELLKDAVALVQSDGWYLDLERFTRSLIDAVIATTDSRQAIGLLWVRDAYTRWDGTIIA